MPLVPTKTYERWFKRKSLVYRQFAYLFTNPLWKCKVPVGFSLCPFFQLAVLSVLFVRPFVLTVILFTAIAKLLRLGSALKWLDARAAKVLRAVMGNFAPPSNLGNGGAAFMLTLLSAVGLFICAALVIGYRNMWASYKEAGVDNLLFWQTEIVIAWIICGVYAFKRRADPNRCRVENYVLLLCVAVMVFAGFHFPSAAFTVFLKWPWEALCFTCSLIFSLIGFCASVLWGWCCSGAGYVGSFFVSIGQAAIASTTSLLLFAASIVLTSLLGAFALKHGLLDEKPEKPGEDVEMAHRRAVMECLARLLHMRDYEEYREFRSAEFWERFVWSLGGIIPNIPVGSPIAGGLMDVIATVEVEAFRRAVEATREVAERTLRRRELCREYSAGCMVVLRPVGRFFKTIGVAFVMGCAAIGIGFWALVTYLWALLKARKAKACPYILFTE